MRLSFHLRSVLLQSQPKQRCHARLQAVARRNHTNTNEMGREKSDAKSSFQLKVPKGTKDWEGTDMVIRDRIFSSITEVFKRHGAVTIDT